MNIFEYMRIYANIYFSAKNKKNYKKIITLLMNWNLLVAADLFKVYYHMLMMIFWIKMYPLSMEELLSLKNANMYSLCNQKLQ